MADQPIPPAAAPKITIDGVDYSADSLSQNAKQHIATIRMADREIRQLETQLMLARIARQTLANSLKNEMAAPKTDATAPQADLTGSKKNDVVQH